MLSLCRETTCALGEPERAEVATSCERVCMGLSISADYRVVGNGVIFGTKLSESVELTLGVKMLLLQLLPFRTEIRVLIRLGRFNRRVGVDVSVSFSWTEQTSEVSSDETDGIPKI